MRKVRFKTMRLYGYGRRLRAVSQAFAVLIVAMRGTLFGAPLLDEPRVDAVATPITLEEAIALAFSQNPDLRAATERIAEAQARLGEATAAFYPQLSARLSYARTDNPSLAFGMILAQRRFSFAGTNFNQPGPTQNVRPEVNGALALFRGGQDYERYAASKLGVEAARLERLAGRNVLADAVIAAYYALLSAPEQVGVAQQSRTAVASALGQARTRVEAGVALKSDTLSLEVRQAATEEDLVRAENAVELARTGLRILLGMSALEPLQVIALNDAAELRASDSINDLLDQARAKRPEIQGASQMVAMREHELKVERAAYLPRVDLVGSYGQDATDLELSRSQDNWMFGATAEIDLFSGFRTRERVAAAERRLAEARQMERKARLEVERDVQTAFLNLKEARQRAQVAEAATGAADEALRLVQEQYQAGVATVTRYLEAEASRTGTHSHAILARYDARRAHAALRKALGEWAEEPRDE